MGRDEQGEFARLIAAIAQESGRGQSPGAPDAIPRSLGLNFVIKLAPADHKGGHAFWASNVVTTTFQIEQSLLAVFGSAIPVDRGTGQLAYGKMRLSTLCVRSLLQQRPELVRFFTLRIAGVTFDALERLQGDRYPQRGLTMYDFAYALEAQLNAALARAQAQIYVHKVAPDPPYHFSCHSDPDSDSRLGGLWPHDQEHMDIVDAWKLDPPAGGKGYGDGVVVGHLDTGWSPHPALTSMGDRLRLGIQYDAVDDAPNASDPLKTSPFNKEPGHGTSTATIIAASDPNDPEKPIDYPNGVLGVATKAQIVPIRVCTSTAFVCNSHVARGLSHAIDVHCDVVSMSVGGLFVPGFEELARVAFSRNMLLVAAAGNCVWLVVYPARFHQCLAVGGSQDDNSYWQYSPHDFCVDVAAPGADVRTTLIVPGTPDVPTAYSYNWGSGTSYSAAYMAGVAALWRAFFYGARSIATATPLQTVFAKSVKMHVCLPPRWSTWFSGTGIANAYKLLHDGPNTTLRIDDRSMDADADQAPDLAPGASSDALPVMRDPDIDEAQSLLGTLSEILYQSSGKTSDTMARVRKWFDAKSDADALQLLDRYGGEMVNLLLLDARKDKKDGLVETKLVETEMGRFGWSLHVYRTAGSKALRDAINL